MDPLMTALKPKLAVFFPVSEGESFEDYAARVVASNFTASQRAMIAAYAEQASKEIRAQRQKRKDEWIKIARLEFNPSPRQPCAICGQYRSLTQAHHSFPLSLQYDCEVTKPKHEHDWLCPTHHVAMHVEIDALIANRQPKFDGIPPDERDAIARLGVRFVNLWVKAKHRSSEKVCSAWPNSTPPRDG